MQGARPAGGRSKDRASGTLCNGPALLEASYARPGLYQQTARAGGWDLAFVYDFYGFYLRVAVTGFDDGIENRKALFFQLAKESMQSV